jgi:apolipoprotein N-acyltransferase
MPDRPRSRLAGPVLVSIASGGLLSAAFPPLGVSWLGWVALVPLLAVLRRVGTWRRAALCGFLAGAVFSLAVTNPLITGYSWTGWAELSSEERGALASQQLILLRLVWLVIGTWGGLFWAAFAGLVFWFGAADPRRLAIAAPLFFVLLPEWARVGATWGFHWGLLGNLTADWASLRQLASLGGIWPLSALIVLGNVALLVALSRSYPASRWRVAGACVAVILAALGLGRALLAAASDPPPGDELRVAAAQHHQPIYRREDFSAIGLDRSFLDLIATISSGDPIEVDFLVLPESIALAVVSLDGSISEGRPATLHSSVGEWARVLSQTLGDSRTVVALGVDTAEAGSLHNSFTFWSAGGMEGWYHKQRLVPLSEYRPALFRPVALAAATEYQPGSSSTVVDLGGVRVGSFICQEVLFPRLLRGSVRNGAQLLLSGGNDGVFEHPAVAEVHAGLAKLRAVESRRYVVRAMKTGISQIIDPRGEEIVRTTSSETAILLGSVAALSTETPYMRFGDWFVVAAACAVILLVFGRVRESLRGSGPKGLSQRRHHPREAEKSTHEQVPHVAVAKTRPSPGPVSHGLRPLTRRAVVVCL